MSSDKIIHEDKHGTDDFPIGISFNDSQVICSNIGNFMYCHWHNEYEFNIITEGNAIVEVNGKAFSVKKGDIVILNSGEVHSSYTIDGNRCCLQGIIFDLEMLSSPYSDAIQKKFLEPVIQHKLKFPTVLECEEKTKKEVYGQLKEILSLYENKSYGYELMIKAKLYFIFSELVSSNILIEQNLPKGTTKEKMENFKQILNFIDQNYKKRIYISTLAEAAKMSQDNFFKFFKRYSGETPVKYINRLKIREASRLLTETNQPILDIALNTGFENVSYFIKTFKAFYKVTPNSYRKNYLNKDPLLQRP